MFLYDIWYFATLARDIKQGELKRVVLAGEPLVLGRSSGGEVFALRDVCPHRAAPLSVGQLREKDGEACLECPYHGWLFRAHDGVCVDIPALVKEQSFETQRIKVRSFPVREQNGLIWVYLAKDKRFQKSPPLEPPLYSERFQDKPRLVERAVFHCHIDHAVVGLMDPSHGPYVHRQWWWRTAGSVHEKQKAFEPRPVGFAMKAHAPSKNSYAYKLLGGTPVTEIVFQLPGIRTETITLGKHKILSFTAVTPVDEKSTEITQVFFWDYSRKLGPFRLPLLSLIKPLMRPMARVFLNQDKRMVDLQQMGLKYQKNLMLVDDADRQAKWYYKLKEEWEAHKEENRPFKNPVEPCVLRWRS